MKRGGPDRQAQCAFNLSKGPSDKWFRKFQQRYQHVSWRVPETIDRSRIDQANDQTIDQFFNLYG